MPEGDVFGPYDKPMKMSHAPFVDFLEMVTECVKDDDSMEGRIAYEWSDEPGVYNVVAMVRNGNSQGQGGMWVLQDMDARLEADANRPPDLLARYVAQVEINNIYSAGLKRSGYQLWESEQKRLEELQAITDAAP